ncbi:MAG: response regulator [Treponema sp.]|nr:response regulator [Treponema sp.]
MSERQKKLFIVDDNNASLTACKKILKPHYEVYPIPSAEKMFDMLRNVIPDLVLLDVDMPEMNGYEAAGRMKKHDSYKDIPIIFLSGRIDPTSEMVGLNLGALDYIHKPFVSDLLLRRLKTNLSMIDSQNERGSKPENIQGSVNKILEILSSKASSDDITELKAALNSAEKETRQLLDQLNKGQD